jgi:hypothetical protein
MTKKKQDPKEALKSLISEARAQAACIEAACALLENTLNGVDPEFPTDFLNKMGELYGGRLVVSHLRTSLQANYVRAITPTK